MGDGEDFNLGQSIFDLLGKKLDADAQAAAARAKAAGSIWTAQNGQYAVNDQGQLFVRGVPSGAGTVATTALASPLVIMGIGILVVTLAVFALKD